MLTFLRRMKFFYFLLLATFIPYLLSVYLIDKWSRKYSTSPKSSSLKWGFGQRIFQERLIHKRRRYTAHSGNKTIMERWDFNILHLRPFAFLKNYKNPCFYYNSSVDEQKIRCLPYFFLVGMPKCGTTDLWKGLTLNRFTALPKNKEPMFFNIRRFEDWTFVNYLDHFQSSAAEINKQYTIINTTGEKYHHLITGDGSVDVSHDNGHWWELPENKGCVEPCYINYHYLHHLNPNLKLIVMIRDPVHRLYSDYLYESRFIRYKTSPEGFHKAVTLAINEYLDCCRRSTHRTCAYNGSFERYEARLRIGMYHIFLEDLYNVFPQNQIMVINFEDYAEHNLQVTKKVFRFLGLHENLTFTEENKLRRRHIEKQQYKESVMLKRTQKMLMDFYEPFNNRLAVFLNNENYLKWNTFRPMEYKRKKISRNFVRE